MVIGVGRVALYLSDGHSLKDKRRVVRAVKDRVQERFNVSIAEIGDLDLWQRAELGFSVVGNDRRHVNSSLDHVVGFIAGLRFAEIVDQSIEVLSV